jgi:hypothetical protein
MARKPDIEYINKFYVHGSEAKVMEFKTSQTTPKTTLPKPIQEKKLSIMVDPVALLGLVVAVTMLIVMAVGLVDYRAACLENQAMESYVSELRNDNILLRHTYRNSFDADTVRETALALGMIPASEARTVTVRSVVPVQEPQWTWWENLKWQMRMLFANA